MHRFSKTWWVAPLDDRCAHARLDDVVVVLRKLGRSSHQVTGRLIRPPRPGAVMVIEFDDGMHEYVTTPAQRVLQIAGKNVWFVETANSRYRLEYCPEQAALEEASLGQF